MKRISPCAGRTPALMATLIGMSCACQAVAATAVCTGNITTVANHAGLGLLLVVGTNNVVSVCSFNSTQFSITPEDCKHMASLAALAFATDVPVVLYVDNPPTINCNEIPNWYVANTRYLALQK